ncbi:putative rRNA maturation factor [Mycoplasmoides fastidiosum]|uniref:Endoribonuclease YbeY n=1 Tax=Mycoplasmoides fastidiosum TaxID=92758 RepID=A0ABU0LZP2_9BACT|nr:rRNA maturation RNase YbeY [Mycoplasmoides fastidiosum]MDQ0514177.1 putative rRNA maturation factor [Mycoplasmoides fastidiosum]UUD37410.1 rRNA maturation RNase YbeY [Mycoplasmoides fastidiosum]
MKFVINNKNNYFITNKMKKNFQIISNEVQKILKLKQDYFFEVNFVSKYIIKKLNNDYRQKNKITDVISFSFLDQPFNQNLLGEIFICYDKCITQAKLYDKTLDREVSFMFLHGLLHLLGYDHIEKEDEVKMFKIQDLVLAKIYE